MPAQLDESQISVTEEAKCVHQRSDEQDEGINLSLVKALNLLCLSKYIQETVFLQKVHNGIICRIA